MPHGLLHRDLALIAAAARAFPEIEQLVLFGSRAKGTYKPGSDVDLAIKGAAVTDDTALGLAEALNEETPLPYFFDVLRYDTIAEPRLVDHIDRAGIVIYARADTGSPSFPPNGIGDPDSRNSRRPILDQIAGETHNRPRQSPKRPAP